MKDCYTIEDMAVFTGLTDRTLRNYLNEGRLTGEKVDGAWRFSPEDLGRLRALLAEEGGCPGTAAPAGPWRPTVTPRSMILCWAAQGRTAAV